MKSRKEQKPARKERRGYVRPTVNTERTLERQVLGSPKLLSGKPGC